MNLQKDLKEFVGLLNARRVKYVIVGGYAVAFHGHPRFTGDIDIFVEPSRENGQLIEDVLADFGFGALGIKAVDFLKPDAVIQLGHPPNRIDLMTGVTGVKFADAWESRVESVIGETSLNFVAKDLLLTNKRATGRAKDLADIESLSGPATDG